MKKYTLREMAQLMAPKPIAFTGIKGSTKIAVGRFSDVACDLSAPISLNAASHYKIELHLTVYMDSNYDVNKALMLQAQIGTLSTTYTTITEIKGSDTSEHSLDLVLDVPKGVGISQAKQIIFRRDADNGYAWGNLNVRVDDITATNLDAKTVAPETLTECLTIIGDYVRSHPELGG